MRGNTHRSKLEDYPEGLDKVNKIKFSLPFIKNCKKAEELDEVSHLYLKGGKLQPITTIRSNFLRNKRKYQVKLHEYAHSHEHQARHVDKSNERIQKALLKDFYHETLNMYKQDRCGFDENGIKHSMSKDHMIITKKNSSIGSYYHSKVHELDYSKGKKWRAKLPNIRTKKLLNKSMLMKTNGQASLHFAGDTNKKKDSVKRHEQPKKNFGILDDIKCLNDKIVVSQVMRRDSFDNCVFILDD